MAKDITKTPSTLVTLSVVVAILVAPAVAAERSKYPRLVVAGEIAGNGIFDISLEYGGDGTGWLAYSWVHAPKVVETHLARSDDHGRSWHFVKVLNHSRPAQLTARGRKRAGVWRYETPCLLYDPGDRPDRRWKLFVERYPVVGPYKPADRLLARGWIEYRYAARPDGAWSRPIRLFGHPASGARVDPNRLDPDLASMKFFNEIGALVDRGVIYVSMDASATASGFGSWDQRRVILLASADHGVNWRYVGTLTDYGDARSFGYQVLTGSSLVRAGGRPYLLLTPAGRRGLFVRNRGHDGVLAVPFTDISRARLARGSKGVLAVHLRIRPDLTSGGLADYDEGNTAGGMLLSQINKAALPVAFQVYSTGLHLIPSDSAGRQ
jgi:hypothetical protein